MEDTAALLQRRLHAQLIERTPGACDAATPRGVVEWLLAMQAQDYAGALWAIGLRCAAETTASDVERAIRDREIVRTWPMRGTLHFVAAEDVRWMLALLVERVEPTWARRHRELELSDDDFARAESLFRDALSGERRLTRAEMLALLEDDGLSTEGQRGYHLLAWLAQRGVLCLGPMDGTQQTFVLLDEWVPRARDRDPAPVSRSDALASLAERYFHAHGPATVDDLARWAGVTKTDARAAIAGARERLEPYGSCGDYWSAPGSGTATQQESPADGAAPPTAHLLPGFDEYYIGYGDRTMLLGSYHATYSALVASNGMLRPTLVIGGRVVGTWQRAKKRAHVEVMVRSFRRLKAGERRAVGVAAERYGRFLGLEPHVSFEEH